MAYSLTPIPCIVSGVRKGEPSTEALFIGLMKDEHGDTVAVVRYAHSGLMLYTVHPSRLTFTPEAK